MSRRGNINDTAPIYFNKVKWVLFSRGEIFTRKAVLRKTQNYPRENSDVYHILVDCSVKQSKIFLITKAFAGMPDGRVKVDVIVDGRSQGMSTLTIRNKMDSLSGILRNVTNPVDFLCSSLRCSDVETLDLELNDMITNGIGDFNPLSGLESRNHDDHLISKILYVKKYNSIWPKR